MIVPAAARTKPIVLVNPPFNRHLSDYPLGLLYIAAVLEEDGHEVKIIDLNFESSWDHFREQLEEIDFDIIGFTALSLYAADAVKAMRIAKEVNPKSTLILGGAHATAVPEECMKEKAVDYLVYGEGEATVRELVGRILQKKSAKSVKGAYLRESGKAHFTGQRPFIEDLDSIPFPARRLMPDIGRYIESSDSNGTTMMASRGCPGNCSYCQPMVRHLFGRKIRMRSPQNVMEEIESIVKAYGVGSVLFRDDTICTQSGWLREFADLMEHSEERVKWWGSARANNLTEEKIADLKRSRCVSITVGVESGCQRVLNILRKGTKVEQARRAAALCKRNGILFVMAVMIGNPGETRDEILATIEYVKKIDPDILDPHITTATPGSDLYYDGMKKGYLYAYDDALLSDREEIAYNFSEVSDEELRELLHHLWREYRRGRRPTRAYCRWRLESLWHELRRFRFVSAAKLAGISLVKADGRIYVTVRSLYRMPLLIKQFFCGRTDETT